MHARVDCVPPNPPYLPGPAQEVPARGGHGGGSAEARRSPEGGGVPPAVVRANHRGGARHCGAPPVAA
eukprot:3744744-Pyramimonas_sp.AAC.1